MLGYLFRSNLKLALILTSLAPNVFCAVEYYSQCGQDRFINENIIKNKRQGVFVDIGAHDGIKYSNTYFFEKNLGWTGICCEPNPIVFAQLKKNRSCVCIQACIANYTGTGMFLQVIGAPEMLSGLIDFYDPKHLARIELELQKDGGEAKQISVQCFRLNEVLANHNISHVDFLSIDTEGSELAILESINFDQVFIDVISIENNYKDKRMRNLLEKNGFRFIKNLSGDEVYKNINA